MTGYYILTAATLFLLFVMFMVISKTMNNMINLLIKLEYLMHKEFDLKKEALEVQRIMDETAKLKESESEKEENVESKR